MAGQRIVLRSSRTSCSESRPWRASAPIGLVTSGDPRGSGGRWEPGSWADRLAGDIGPPRATRDRLPRSLHGCAERVQAIASDGDVHPFDPDFTLAAAVAPRPRRAGARVSARGASAGPRRHPAGAGAPRRARRCARSRSTSGWRRARSTRGACSARSASAGDDVATIFKGMQFDVGAPHGFLDFRFRVHDDGSGEFWLPYCGALMDVEPMGEEFVVGMCHHIEDPTFDATAGRDQPARPDAPDPPPAARARRPAPALPLARARSSPTRAPVEEIPLTERVRALASGAARLPALPQRRASRAAAPTTRARSIPTSSSRTSSHAALVPCRRGVLPPGPPAGARASCWRSPSAGARTTRARSRAQQWVGIAGVAAERMRAAMGIARRRPRRAREALPAPSRLPSARLRRPSRRARAATRCAAGSTTARRSPRATRTRGSRCSARRRIARSTAIARTVNPRARCRPVRRSRARASRGRSRSTRQPSPRPSRPRSRSRSSARA